MTRDPIPRISMEIKHWRAVAAGARRMDRRAQPPVDEADQLPAELRQQITDTYAELARVAEQIADHWRRTFVRLRSREPAPGRLLNDDGTVRSVPR